MEGWRLTIVPRYRGWSYRETLELGADTGIRSNPVFQARDEVECDGYSAGRSIS